MLKALAVAALVTTADAAEPLVFDKVVEVEGKTPEELYTLAHGWFATTYNSANDVIQMADRESATIIGKGTFEFKPDQMRLLCYTGTISYTLRFEARDGRYKTTVGGFSHKQLPGYASNCGLGSLTTATEHSSAGLQKRFNNQVWIAAKASAEAHAAQLIDSMLESVKTAATPQPEDDW